MIKNPTRQRSTPFCTKITCNFRNKLCIVVTSLFKREQKNWTWHHLLDIKILIFTPLPWAITAISLPLPRLRYSSVPRPHSIFLLRSSGRFTDPGPWVWRCIYNFVPEDIGTCKFMSPPDIKNCTDCQQFLYLSK